MVRAGVFSTPASVSVQSGGASGEGVDQPGDGLPPMRADPIASLPAGNTPPPMNLSAAADPALEDVAPIASHKEPRELLDAVESPIIGLSSDLAGDSSPQFPHRLPAALQNATSGGAASAIHQANADGASTGDSAPSASIGLHREGVSDSPGTGAGSSGTAGDQPIGLSGNKAPAYPREAKRRREQGTVWLSIEVLEDGTVGQISVSQSSGYELLDQAALDAVKRWQFTPAKLEGRFVRSEGRLPIEFVLRG